MPARNLNSLPAADLPSIVFSSVPLRPPVCAASFVSDSPDFPRISIAFPAAAAALSFARDAAAEAFSAAAPVVGAEVEAWRREPDSNFCRGRRSAEGRMVGVARWRGGGTADGGGRPFFGDGARLRLGSGFFATSGNDIRLDAEIRSG